MKKILMITGTTSGIGKAFLNQDVSKFKIISANRNIVKAKNAAHSDIYLQMDMSDKNSIISAVCDLYDTYLIDEKISVLVLNAGIKSTRKNVIWDNENRNKCIVVNLLANKFLIELLHEKGLLSENVRIIFTTSILHFNASKNPFDCNVSLNYANTKLSLFYLAEHFMKLNKNWTFLLFNPGMVKTNIFQDFHHTNLFSIINRNIRNMFSIEPSTVAPYLLEAVNYNGYYNAPIYLTLSNESNIINFLSYYFPSMKILQDVFGCFMLSKKLKLTEPSNLVYDKVVKNNYSKFIEL